MSIGDIRIEEPSPIDLEKELSSKQADQNLKESEEKYRTLAETSPDAIIMADMNWNINMCNRHFLKMIGQGDILEVLDSSFFSYLLKTHKKHFLKDFDHVYIEGRVRNLKYAVKNSKGKRIPVEINASVIIDSLGTPIGIVCVIRDISDKKAAERALVDSEKYAQIGKQAAILTHEIKTPLASIKTNIDMLYRDLSLPASNQRSLQIIQKEIKRLVKLLKNVLQYSKEIELILTPVELGRMFENLKDFMRPLMEESHIEMINKVSNFRIKGDYKNLQTVFMHMLENCIESTNGNGVIEISSEKTEEADIIYIRDNGCGISDPQKIFQPFYTTKNTGTGLGLTIAFNILKQHNAELSLLRSIPGDTVFQIKFNKDQE